MMQMKGSPKYRLSVVSAEFLQFGIKIKNSKISVETYRKRKQSSHSGLDERSRDYCLPEKYSFPIMVSLKK